MKKTLAFLTMISLGGAAFASGALAQQRANSLDELLEQVKNGSVVENREHRQREAEFLRAKNNQAQLLRKAKQAKVNEEHRSKRLEKSFENNETELARLEALLASRLGTLGELFGVVRQVAGDTKGVTDASIVTAQFPGRGEFLGGLAQKKELPEVAELEKLWFELMREMTETGKVVRFPATVVALNGSQVDQEVVRIGAFNTVADGKYLQFLAESGKLAELPRQPQSRFLDWAAELGGANSGVVGFGIDPSRGSILSLLIEKPNLMERVQQGGLVGYVILLLGAVGVALVIFLMFSLYSEGRKVTAQSRQPGSPNENNSLGRVLAAYDQNRNVDVETLELKLDEAILRELPKLERGLSTVKVISVVAPLLGLLGTVTGMIATFQAITLFGTGDPKLMAGGISQALMTTVLGLVVAIPTVLLHSLVSGRSKKIVHILEEQSAGLIAVHAEEQEGHASTR
ncbi:MAG: MotA/TolQ/ExbB proton channel family protein [Sphingomonadales bacterium]